MVQEQHGFYYLNWKEKHVGKFCYNGSDVWIWAKGGYDYCDRGYGMHANVYPSGNAYFYW